MGVGAKKVIYLTRYRPHQLDVSQPYSSDAVSAHPFLAHPQYARFLESTAVRNSSAYDFLHIILLMEDDKCFEKLNFNNI